MVREALKHGLGVFFNLLKSSLDLADLHMLCETHAL
jgi:hypothetical protein